MAGVDSALAPSRPATSRAVRRALTLVALLALACRSGPDERVLRFWAMGSEGERVRALVPDFERAHPGLTVEVQSIPWTAAHEKLLTAHVGHTTPDAAQLGNTWIPEFTALGALAPLDERIAAAKLERVDFFPGIWDTNVVDGETWGLPWYVDTRVIFYRTDLVAAAGGPWPPRTWNEWRATLERLKKLAGPDRFAILLPVDEWDKPVLLGLEAGATLLADGRRGAFRDPRFRRAMSFYTGLYADRLAPPLDLTGLVNLYQQFVEGYFAMVVTGPWNLGEFRRRLPAAFQDRWSTAPLPAADDGAPYPGASLAGGASLVMFRAARLPEETWEWIRYLAAAKQQARFYELTGDLPARRSAWEASGLAADPRAAAFLTQLGHVVPAPKVPEWEQIATRIAECAEQIARGGSDVDAALARLDADVDRMLERRRYLLDRAARGAP